MITESRTIFAIPPGETIKEQLEARRMTQKEFALRMDMSEKHISQLINGEVRLTPNTAIRLESVIGLSASFWLNLEAYYETQKQKADAENELDADIELAKKMPYAEIACLGWIDSAKKITDKVKNLRRFFEVAHLGVIERLKIPGIAYRMVGENDKSDYVLAVWAQKARLLAREVDVSPINIQGLKRILSEVRKLTIREPSEIEVPLKKYYGDCGIALVFLPHLKGSFLQGASFLDGKKIVLALTLRGVYADKFWFSLFHETGHIIEGHINKSYGADKDDEAQANKFAQDILIPPEIYAEFLSQKDFTRTSVEKFAAEVGIDAGIVVGRLQSDGEIDFSQLNELKRHYSFREDKG